LINFFLRFILLTFDFYSAISPQLWGLLQISNTLTIRQHVKLLPKNCCACPPCVKQENTYSVYAGLTKDAEYEILRVDEVSDDWNRCCCAPYHPLKLEVRQYIPVPGDNTNTDYSHLTQDTKESFARLTGRDRQLTVQNMYKQSPVLMSMVRNDGQRCCAKCPCKLLSSFVCFECCQDGMHIYADAIQNPPEGQEIGRPVPGTDTSKLIGSVIQPVYGGWFTPTLHLRGEGALDTDVPFGKIEGPCFFGGWSECCCDFQFQTSHFNSAKRTGDVALITKKKPASLAGAFVELFSDADVYTIKFNEEAKLSAAEKTTVMAGQLLADYMFFDGNTEKCSQDEDAIYCYCCYYSCIGAICPCYIAIPKNAG
jgi:hypothetical protein